MAVVFISYAREDELFALRIAHDLRSGGKEIWVDQLDIRPSELWERAIEEALSRCTQLIVVLSPASIKSNNVMAEVNFVLDEGKPVIPVFYQECRVPYRLRLFQRADFTREYKEGMNQLSRALGGESHKMPEPEDRPDPPPGVNDSKGTPSREAVVRALFSQPQWNGKIHVDPNIPKNMLANARKSYNVDERLTVIGLVDTTVFSSASEAVLFSAQGMYFPSSDSTRFLTYDDLRNFSFRSSSAPFLSKYVWQIFFDTPGLSRIMGIAGGPFSTQQGTAELISLFEALKRI